MEIWSRQTIDFTVRLGEIRLLSWQLTARVLKTHFTRLPSIPVIPSELSEWFDESLDVIVTRSHPVEAPLPKISALPQAIRYVPASYQRYWVSMEDTFDVYLKKFSAKSRNTLMRKIKKFTEFSGGEIDWREYRKPDEMQIFHQLGLEVSRKTYQERLLDCGLPAEQSFLDKIIELAKEDNAHGYILFHQKKPVAYIFCPIQEGVALYEYVGHDPDYQQWSPGTLLQYFALQRLFATGNVKIFDFTEGEGAHKAFFSTHSQYCADIYYFRQTLKNSARVRLHAGCDNLSKRIVQLLDFLKIKSVVKKLLRSHA
ncbi:MAG: hypothetical protein RI993_740 [Pseudomonadota bacterium]|jgi:CelD/BcsL family acetyltransferase involved in cellulose biosynthesis